MKHFKHMCHSNKKSYLRCWQNQTMKKRILQLTGTRWEHLYTHIKSHWKTPLTPTQFPESHQAQTFPIGSLKVQFSHRKICQYWRNIIWCSVHTHLHSHHMSPKQHSHLIFSKMKKELDNSFSILSCQSFGIIFSSTRILHPWCHPILQGCKLVLTVAETYKTNNTHFVSPPPPPPRGGGGWGGTQQSISIILHWTKTHSQSF